MSWAAQREALAMRARLPFFERKVENSKVALTTALERMRRPYVAFSGGKDSSVVLHMVREQRPDTPALMGYDDWHLPETLALIAETTNVTRIAATIRHSSFFTSWPAGPIDLPRGVIWFEAVKNSRVAPYALERGFDGACLGLRKQEAVYRRFHLSSHGLLFFCKTHGVLECNPIGDWTVEDVWSYLLSRDVPYNRAYDRMAEIGISLANQRIGPFAVEKVLGFGQLAILKRGWPELFNKFAARYPEAACYV